MTEHNTLKLKPLDVLDWRVFEHYSRLQPDGVVYVTTGRGYVFTAAGRSGYDVRLEQFGADLTYWKATVLPGRTSLGGSGTAVRVLSANRRISSPDDLNAIRGFGLPNSEQPAWVSLKSLDSRAAGDPANLYFLVRKFSHPLSLSVFWGKWHEAGGLMLH